MLIKSAGGVCVFVRGVLAIAWSLADPELLLSCGKDNRILCWNPNTAEVSVCVCVVSLFLAWSLTTNYSTLLIIIITETCNQKGIPVCCFISRCCMSCLPVPSGALTSSGVPGTRRCCRPQPSTDTSASTPSWGAAARLSARHRQTRWVNSFTYEHC